jgi:hypothetical protein
MNQMIFRSKALLMSIALLVAVAPEVLQVSAAQGAKRELLGEAVPSNQTGRLIRILPSTSFVNVRNGEVIRFETNGKFFSWSFDGALDVNSFVLNRVMPGGMLDHRVTVYIAPNPDYSGPF